MYLKCESININPCVAEIQARKVINNIFVQVKKFILFHLQYRHTLTEVHKYSPSICKTNKTYTTQNEYIDTQTASQIFIETNIYVQ